MSYFEEATSGSTLVNMEDALIYSIATYDLEYFEHLLSKILIVGKYSIATAAVLGRIDMLMALYTKKYPNVPMRVQFGDISQRIASFIGEILANTRKPIMRPSDVVDDSPAVRRLMMLELHGVVYACGRASLTLEHDIVLLKDQPELIRLYFDSVVISSAATKRRLMEEVAPKNLFTVIDVLVELNRIDILINWMSGITEHMIAHVITYLVHREHTSALTTISRAYSGAHQHLIEAAVAFGKHNLIRSAMNTDDLGQTGLDSIVQ